MSIFVDETTKVVVQGISPTSQGLYHGLRNKAYGTQVVGGTNPKRGGEEVEGIPVFASVAEAVKETGATASFISVPPRGAADAILEAADAGIAFIVCITEGIPAQDEAVAYNRLVQEFPGTRLLGPNCPGIISPGKCNIGITSGDIALPGGPVGIVSRSGTLTYQALHELSQQGIGQTTCVGIGGDPVPGTNFIDCLAAFEADPETKAVMMIGEIGGSEEERAADFIAANMTKPVAAYIAGVTAPPDARWATPAPSSRAPTARPRPRWRRWPPPASRWRRTPPSAASGSSPSCATSASAEARGLRPGSAVPAGVVPGLLAVR